MLILSAASNSSRYIRYVCALLGSGLVSRLIGSMTWFRMPKLLEISMVAIGAIRRYCESISWSKPFLEAVSRVKI